jgi:hypothetical protein
MPGPKGAVQVMPTKKMHKTGDISSKRGVGPIPTAQPKVSAGRPDRVGSPTRPAPGGPEASGEPTPLEGAIQTALASLEVLEQHAHELADGFRWNQVAAANQGLADLMQGTRTMLALASMTADVTGADLRTLCGAGSQNVDEDTRLAVGRLIECEEQEDWPALADTLDQDFASALGQWRDVFSALASHPAPPEPPGRAA